MAAVIGLVVAPSWQLGVAVLCLALVPVCVAGALLRRRRAEALLASSPAGVAGRRPAVLHLQEAGLVLLAVGLIGAACGAVASR